VTDRILRDTEYTYEDLLEERRQRDQAREVAKDFWLVMESYALERAAQTGDHGPLRSLARDLENFPWLAERVAAHKEKWGQGSPPPPAACHPEETPS
jgi:hypothetical protein